MSNIEKDYYLGLDVGTNSVGWAVTDTEYNLLKLKGKSAWGVRLFDEAKTAKARRLNRSNRRRKKRQEWRLELIRKLFEEEINKIDDSFFIRMENSKYFIEDKDIKEKYVLFADKKYTDKDYFKEYPTIYHLRKELIETNKPHDIRLVFLAIYHIVKHRGHFLWDNYNVNGNNSQNIEKLIDDYLSIIEDTFNIEFEIEIEKIVNILVADNSKNDKKRELKQLIENNIESGHEQKCILNLFYLIIGSQVNIKEFINIDDDDKESSNDEKFSLSFETLTEEQMDKVFSLLSEGMIEMFNQGKEIFDFIKLNKILGDCTSISERKIKDYDKHKEDLKILKELIKSYLPEKYNEVFKESNDKKNYASYTGKLSVNGNKKYVKGCNREDFYKYIKSIIKNINSVEAQEIINQIELDMSNNIYLPLERWSDNGVIPNQLHRYELEKILNNAKTYLDFLDNKDEKGLSVIEKILKTFDFRIPYYIGPLNEHHKNCLKTHNRKGAWVTFKENKQKLYPWNYLEQIDVNKTAEDFIIRMTNKCTYLPDEDVLPKNSLLYQEFMVLNEINVLRINNNRLSKNEKDAIFALFLKKKNVKIKNIIECLVSNGFYNEGELTIDNFTGINKSKDIINSLSTYHKFKEFFNDDIKKDKIKEIVDKIIFYLTIYNDGGNIAKERIDKELGLELHSIFKDDYDKVLGKISKMKYSGWGNFSRKFLEYAGIKKIEGDGAGVKKPLISHLRENSLNLMEIIETDNFDYKDRLKEERKTIGNSLKYNIVDELYVSPSVRRAIWQTLKIVDEIISIIGKKPKRIFIEMARSDEEKVETASRKDALLKLYDNIDGAEYDYVKNELEKETNLSLRKKDLYLYYTQLGKDMYTGEKIDLDELRNRKTYDIDHIYPRSKSAQDSITKNLVLVNKKVNARKSDAFPLDFKIQNKMKTFWNLLKNKNLITAEKYNRLIRTTGFNDDELVGFIDRQLVETRQSTKEIKNILFDYLNPDGNNNTAIVSVHANLVSKFRNGENMKKDEHGDIIKYTSFPKVRFLNDFHHAKDAYLNIVVGNVYNTKFTNNIREWVKKNRDNYSLNWMYGYNIDKAWVAGENGTIKQVESVMGNNDIIVTKLTYEDKGMLYKQQALPSKINDSKSKSTTGLKGKGRLLNIEKYGGYTEVNNSYFVICKYDLIESKKGKEKRTTKISLRGIAIKDLMKIRNSKEYILSKDKHRIELIYIKDLLISDIRMENIDKGSIENLELVKEKILKNSVISINNYKYYLVGVNDLCSAEELVVSADVEKYLKQISSYVSILDKMFNGKDLVLETVNEIADRNNIILTNNIKLYDLLIDKFENTVYKNRVSKITDYLNQNRDNYLELNLYEQCKIILEILENFNCSVTKRIKLKLLNVNKEIGRLSKTINFNNDKVILYNYSITGLYCEKEYLNGMANNKN